MLFISIFYVSSCGYSRIIKPETQPLSANLANTHSVNKLKFSYIIYDIYLGGKISDRPAEKALLDSFATFGIIDVTRSDNAMQDHTNIFVYVYRPITESKTGYIEPWLSLLYIGTLGVVPVYDVRIYPVEIHLITQRRGRDKQIQIINTEYVIESQDWLPYVFMPKDETLRNRHALYDKFRARNEGDYLAYLGFRRIYERVISESLKDLLQ